jgi:hypothetical protein
MFLFFCVFFLQGNYVTPTVFSNVTDDMTIFKEEVFGPVMTLNRFSSLEDVISRANDSDYGLACGVFTNDIKKVGIWCFDYLWEDVLQRCVPFVLVCMFMNWRADF